MSDLIPLVFLLCAICTNVGFFTGVNIGEKNGSSKAWKETITFCTETPKKCKVVYDYLQQKGKQQ